MSLKLFAPLAAALTVAACTNQPPQLAASDPRNEGIAKTCTPTNPDFTKPGPYTGSIAMTNDGWCGVFAVERGGGPFRYGLVPVRPAHGRLLIQRVANATRVEYTPLGSYTGPDTFTVALVSTRSGVEDAPLTVSVTVGQGDRPVEAAPTTTTNRPAAASKPTTRRSTTRRATTPAR